MAKRQTARRTGRRPKKGRAPKKGRVKVSKVMRGYKRRTLRSGSGGTVR